MKIITIAGRLGKDAALRRTQSGDPILGFSVAVDDGYGERKTTMWFDVSIFGKRGEALEQHLTKGTAVTVSGTFSTREHVGKTYLQVRANEITMQGGGKSDDKPARQHHPAQDRDDPRTQGGAQPDLDDEIPFIMEWR